MAHVRWKNRVAENAGSYVRLKILLVLYVSSLVFFLEWRFTSFWLFSLSGSWYSVDWFNCEFFLQGDSCIENHYLCRFKLQHFKSLHFFLPNFYFQWIFIIVRWWIVKIKHTSDRIRILPLAWREIIFQSILQF